MRSLLYERELDPNLVYCPYFGKDHPSNGLLWNEDGKWYLTNDYLQERADQNPDRHPDSIVCLQNEWRDVHTGWIDTYAQNCEPNFSWIKWKTNECPECGARMMVCSYYLCMDCR